MSKRKLTYTILSVLLIVSIVAVIVIAEPFKNRDVRSVSLQADAVDSITIARTWSMDLPIFITEDRDQIIKVVQAWNDLHVITGYDELAIDWGAAKAGGSYSMTLSFKDGQRVTYSLGPFDHIVALKPISEEVIDQVQRDSFVTGDHFGLIQQTDKEEAFIQSLYEVSGWEDNPYP